MTLSTPHELGLCSVTFRALAPAAVVEFAASAGVAAIEWGSDRHVPPGDLAVARGTAQRCADAGIRVSSYGSYVEAGASTGQAFGPVLDSAVALGAPLIRVWAGARGVGSREAKPEARTRTVQALQAMGSEAARAGIAVALEYHPRTLTDSLASTLALLAEAAHSNVLSYWQPRPGIDSEESLDELSSLRPWLAHLHVFAWTVASERLALVDHEAMWLARLRLSVQLPPKLPGPRMAMIEFVEGDDPGAFRRDARTLERWLAAVNAPTLPPR